MKMHLEDGILLRMMDDELTPAEYTVAKQHLAECQFCRERISDLSQVSAELALFSVENLPSVHDSARDELLVALSRQEKTILQTPVSNQPISRVWMIGTGIAAMLALVAIMLGFRSERNAPSVHSPETIETAEVTQAPAPAAVKQETDAHSAVKVAKKESEALSKRPAKERSASAAVKHGNEEGTPLEADADEALRPFIELPYSDKSIPLSAYQVVRVQMRAASLASTGLIAASPTDERWVQADVLLGMDGQPRGIRFVPAAVPR